MSYGLGCVLAAMVVGAGAPESPPAWSPDGRWLAYVLAVREPAVALPPGWLFEATSGASSSAPSPRTYRLWATPPAGGESVLLDESPRPIVSPSWNPDGTRLVYGRLAPGDGPSQVEVVVQEAPDRREVLATFPVDHNGEPASIDASVIAWGPDGKHIAVALPGPPRLWVLRAENGNTLKEVAEASKPSWSPDGQRLAFYRRGGLAVLDASLGQPQELMPMLETERLPTPIWARDSQTVWVILRGTGPGPPGRAGGRTERAELVRIAIETGRASRARELLHEPVVGAERFLGASFTFDADGNQLFYTTTVAGQRSQITWAFPRDQAVRSRFNPVDEWTPLGVLRFAPTEAMLALRAGGSGPESPMMLIDPAGTNLQMMVPDAASRAEWTAMIVEAMRRVVAEHPQQDADGHELPRPTLLPAPGELSGQSLLQPRLRHLARIGRQLVEPVLNPENDDTPASAVDPEALLAFTYLDQDPERSAVAYRAAMGALEAVEAATERPRDRERLLVLRSQIDLGLGERDRALATLAYLQTSRPGPIQQIEETSRGFVFTPVTNPMAGWVGYLVRRASDPDDGDARLESVDRAMGNINFDAPQPGLGLDLDAVPPAPPPDPRVDVVPVFPREPAPVLEPAP